MGEILKFKGRRKKKKSGDDGGQRPSPADREIDVTKCPVKPLGKWQGTCFYMSRLGELRQLRAREHRELEIIDLFDGKVRWLVENFNKYWGGEKTRKWDKSMAATWLIEQCAEMGHFDPQTVIRGPGVWQDQNKRILVHCGDRISIDGVWAPAGIVKDGVLYPASPRIARPAAKPCSSTQARALLAAARCWKFKAEGGADLWVGWVGAALLGGAPGWRAHLFTTGERGCGKSWLADLASAALGGAGHPPLNNFTEAYIRQALTAQARALILDESERDDAGALRIKAVIELIRHMSGGVGARVGRGSAGGQAMTFPITGCAYLSAVLRGHLKPQDKSRILTLTLNQLPTGIDHTGGHERALAEIVKIRELSPRLWARAIAGWDRFQDTFGAYRAGFMSLGCDARQSDQAATILAGRDLLLEDAAPDHASVREIIGKFSYLVEAAAEDDDESEGRECLTQLYTAPAEQWRGGDHRTVSQVIMEGMQAGEVIERGALGSIGLRIERQCQPGQAVLLVAKAHVGLQKIFEGTRWHNGGWTEALRYLDGVKPWPVSVRIDGVMLRVTVIPFDWLPRDEPAEPPEPEEDL